MYTEGIFSWTGSQGQGMAYDGILKNEAGRLTHLVDNVLSYARVEKNSVSLQPEKIPVTDLASAVIARISPGWPPRAWTPSFTWLRSFKRRP